MAYSRYNLFLVDQGGGGEAQSWVLEHAETLMSTAYADNYISDAQDRNMNAGDKIRIVQYSADPVANDSRTLVDMVEGFVISVSSSGAVLGGGEIPYAAIPTVDGTGTGLIPDYARLVTITSVADANYWITLPTARTGKRLTVINLTGTGMEIRSAAPATVSISGGAGASAESAVASTALRIELVAISSTKWIANSYVAASTESAVEAAA